MSSSDSEQVHGFFGNKEPRAFEHQGVPSGSSGANSDVMIIREFVKKKRPRAMRALAIQPLVQVPGGSGQREVGEGSAPRRRWPKRPRLVEETGPSGRTEAGGADSEEADSIEEMFRDIGDGQKQDWWESRSGRSGEARGGHYSVETEPKPNNRIEL